MTTLYLAFLLGICAMAGVDAIRDKTPRKPWVWARPPLEFWALRRTKRERARTQVVLSSERAVQGSELAVAGTSAVAVTSVLLSQVVEVVA